MWFVVHVKPGAEEQAVNLLKSTTKSDGLQEVFTPIAERIERVRGELVTTTEPMIEGCVFVVAPSKWELRACMRQSEPLEQLLARSPSFSAMKDGEERFIQRIHRAGWSHGRHQQGNRVRDRPH